MDLAQDLLDWLRTSIHQGALYSVLVLGLVFSFKVVRFPDLTVDGTFVLGASVAASGIYYYHAPILGTIGAFFLGAIAGTITGLLHIKIKINKILCGILVMTMLYTVNLYVMGRSNIPLADNATLFTLTHLSGWSEVVSLIALAVALYLAAAYLMKTRFGLYLRATGENPELVYSLGRDSNHFVLFALALSNGLIALSGALIAQDNGNGDVNMGLGVLIVGLASLFLGETAMLFFAKRLAITSGSKALLAAAFGAVSYFIVRSGALRLGLPPQALKLVTGLIIILVLSLPLRDRRLPFGDEDLV